MEVEKMVSDWLALRASTAIAMDLDAHMQLVSADVQVFGVPGFEVIGYDDWRRQCDDEFSNRLLADVSYGDARIVAQTDARIMFRTRETIRTKDGEVLDRGLEIVIEVNPSGQWQVTQERVLPDEETRHSGLW